MRLFGLIGFPLSHSFSKKYFSKKFEAEQITDAHYELFEIPEAASIIQIISENPSLKGLNVTIPHKETVIPYLHTIDEPAKKIGAVNVIKIEAGKLKGFNSDYHGFKQSLLPLLPSDYKKINALILGTGGASKAVKAALTDLGITYRLVSRTRSEAILSYAELTPAHITQNHLIINTSPLGMHPNTNTCPDIPYEALSSRHILFDLVYNPEETLFMKKGKEKGAIVKNGLEMLTLQAEKAWEIWNS